MLVRMQEKYNLFQLFLDYLGIKHMWSWSSIIYIPKFASIDIRSYSVRIKVVDNETTSSTAAMDRTFTIYLLA